MYHGRNKANRDIIGLCLDTLPVVYNHETKEIGGHYTIGNPALSKEIPAMEKQIICFKGARAKNLIDIKTPVLNWLGNLESLESLFDKSEEDIGVETYSTLYDLFLSKDEKALWIRVNDKMIDSVRDVIHTVS